MLGRRLGRRAGGGGVGVGYVVCRVLRSSLVPQRLRVASLASGHGLRGRGVHLGPGRRERGAVVLSVRGTVDAGGRGQGVGYEGGQVRVTPPSASRRVAVAAVARARHLVLSPAVHRLSLVLHGHTSPAARVVRLPHASLHYNVQFWL